MEDWIEGEVNDDGFADARLAKRLKALMSDMASGLGNPIPLACQDWAATKGAYRFLSNDRVDESCILEGHFQATAKRFAASNGFCFVLHDTTEFSYHRSNPEKIGKTKSTFVGRDKKGRPKVRTVCGLLLHASLVLNTNGLPLGLASAKFWTRKKFKDTKALRRKTNPTRIPIECKESYRWTENLVQATRLLRHPQRCIHIGDRESDIYELFCAAREENTHFLVRTCVDRLTDGDGTIRQAMQSVPVSGEHEITLQDESRHDVRVTLHVRYHTLTIRPPVGKQKRYPDLRLTVIHALEKDPPEGRDAIAWKLLTDLPVESHEDAVEKLDWYTLRWNIETYFKILKSGCKAEESKLRTASRLSNLIAIMCILGWRIFWLRTINRVAPDAPPSLVFTEAEIAILDTLRPSVQEPKTITHYLTAVACMGGYLGRANDSPPGNMVLWRGFSRLTDIHLGYTLRDGFVGN